MTCLPSLPNNDYSVEEIGYALLYTNRKLEEFWEVLTTVNKLSHNSNLPKSLSNDIYVAGGIIPRLMRYYLEVWGE